MDREKVIKGLECCQSKTMLWQHDQCPYHGFDEDCESNLHADALALLKEQQEEIENLKQTAQSMMEGICLLKEQEAVKPQLSMSELWYECPVCHRHLTKDSDKFCARCGRAVKWE